MAEEKDYDIKIKFNKYELPSITIEKNDILKHYIKYKYYLGMFYGYLIGSSAMFAFMILIINN